MFRKILIGCGGLILLGFVVLVLGIFVGGPWMLHTGQKWFSAQIQEANRRSALELAWQPPAAQLDARWFPPVVDGWTLSTSEDVSTVPELALDRAGRRGKYRGATQEMEVIIVPCNELERDGLFNRAVATLNQNSKRVIEGTTENASGQSSYHFESTGSHFTTRTTGRLYVRINGNEHTRLWWIKEWLFIFRTVGDEDPDVFADKFIEAMKPVELEQR